MTYYYAAFGLLIESAVELPELGEHGAAPSCVDLTIRFGDIPDLDSLAREAEARWLDPQHLWFPVESVAHFLISEGRDIIIMPEPGVDPSTLRAYLLGSVCGALLVQRGFLILHGNAIQVGDGCLVCVGDSGAGKSTLAAAFLRRGYPVLADDVVAVDAQGCAIPGFPRIKLWQDSADQLGFPTEGRIPVVPGMDKFNLPIESFDPDVRLPIRWIYHLSGAERDDVQIKKIDGLHRFRLLRDNTYRGEYLDGHTMFADHLAQCGQLASQVRIASVERPEKGFAIDQLIDCLLADSASAGP